MHSAQVAHMNIKFEICCRLQRLNHNVQFALSQLNKFEQLGSKYFIDPKAFVYETWLLVEMIYVFDLLAAADDSFKNVCKKCC